MRYRKTDRADEDIIDVYVWGFEKFGRDQAEAYQDGLEACFDMLAEHPRIGRVRDEFSPPVRVHVHSAHVVVYRVEADGVLILRVLDARRDWGGVLRG